MVFEVLRKLFVSANGLGFGLQKGCKTVYTSSILVVASAFNIFDINDLALFFETPGRALSRVRNPLGTHSAAQKGTHRASIRRGPVDRCPGHSTALYGLPDIGVAVWFRSLARLLVRHSSRRSDRERTPIKAPVYEIGFLYPRLQLVRLC